MAFDNTKLSYFHSFSKMPAQDSTTLGNAINKSGHTVTASEVWAQDIPYYGKMGSLDDVKSKVQPYARKNDMCYITAGADKGKTFQYDGNGNWTDITATLIDGALIKNANDDVVLLYHKGQTLTNLTADNNANTDSADNAARLWAKRDTKGATIANNGTRLIEQFAAPTDKALNGLASVAYAPVIANGSLVSGTDYYDYCFSGTILWASKRTTSTVIDCFEYVGDKLDTSLSDIRKDVQDIIGTTMEGVVASVGANEAAQNAGIGVDSTTKTSPKITFTAGSVAAGETKLVTGDAVKTYVDTTALAAGGSIAEYVEDYVATNAKVSVNGQSATTITVAGTETTSSDLVHIKVTEDKTTTDKIGLTLTATLDAAVLNEDGSIKEDGVVIATIAKDIADSAITSAITTDNGAIKDAIDSAISDATLTSGDNAIASATSDTATKLVTAEQVKEYVDENAKVTLTAGTGISIPNGGTPGTSFEVSIASDYLVKASDVTAISDRVTTLETVTVPGLEGTISGVSQTVADIQTSLSTGAIHSEIVAAKSAADAAMEEAQKKVASVSGPATGLITVTGDKDVTITVSDTIATKTDAATAASTAITTSLAGTTTGTIGGAITSAVSGLETKLTTGEGSLGSKVTALEGSVKTITETTIPNAITTAQNGAVTTVKALTLSATDSDDAAKVTVTLGGTVETPTITVTSSDIASAQTLATLKSTVETHISEAAGLYLSVEKVDTLPADADAKANKIYLVPVDTEAGRAQNIHTEYIWTNGQWEIIGTTAIDINSLEASAKAAQDAADKAQGEVDAVEEAIAAMDADLTVNGISVKQVDGKVTELSETLITASVPADTTSVVGNIAYVGATKHVIAPEKFQTAAQMPSTLSSWVADLSNLTVGDNMFKDTALTTFIGDLSSLTSAAGMFNGCTLDDESWEIIADTLPSVEGEHIIHMGIYTVDTWSSLKSDCLEVIENKGWSCQHEMGGDF